MNFGILSIVKRFGKLLGPGMISSLWVGVEGRIA